MILELTRSEYREDYCVFLDFWQIFMLNGKIEEVTEVTDCKPTVVL